MDRSDFAAVLAARAGDGPVPKVAAEIVADPAQREALVEWLLDRAPALVGRELKRLAPPPERQRSAPTTTVERFQCAAGAGDIEALSDFGLVYRVRSVDKCLGDLTASDHREVAAGFQSIGESSLMLSAVHRQIARLIERAGSSATTSQVVSPEQYRALLERLAPALT